MARCINDSSNVQKVDHLLSANSFHSLFTFRFVEILVLSSLFSSIVVIGVISPSWVSVIEGRVSYLKRILQVKLFHDYLDFLI